jgi:hypothetical protein
MAPEKGRFINIVEEDDVFDWQYSDPENGEKFATVFQLRTVPEDTQKAIRKRYTKRGMRRGQPTEEMDNGRIAESLIDYAVVDWRDLMGRSPDPDNPGRTVETPVDCTTYSKGRLPEPIKIEVIRLCVGRELGNALYANQIDENEDEDVPSDPQRRRATTKVTEPETGKTPQKATPHSNATSSGSTTTDQP